VHQGFQSLNAALVRPSRKLSLLVEFIQKFPTK